MVLRVEDHDAQLLALETAHLQGQPVRDVARTTDEPARCRPVGKESASELECRHELGRFRGTDAGDPGELEVRRPREAGKPVVCRQRVGRQLDGGTPADPAAPQQRDQLRGREPARAAKGQAFARSFGFWELADGMAGRA